MAAVTEALDKIRQVILKNEYTHKYAELIEEKTKIHIEYFVVALAFIPLIMVYYGYFGKTVSDLVGFLYPVFATIKSIEAKNSEDVYYWVTYWVVYSLFNVIEDFVDALLHWWLPLFYPLKMAFFIWLYLPQTNGAKLAYKHVVLKIYTPISDVVNKME